MVELTRRGYEASSEGGLDMTLAMLDPVAIQHGFRDPEDALAAAGLEQ